MFLIPLYFMIVISTTICEFITSFMKMLLNISNSFGFKTLERSYLLRINGKVAERPQHMLMRVAVGIVSIQFYQLQF